jgi:male germ cell-associated kinase
MEKYKVIKTLGEGAYGIVLKALNTETQEVVAIKRMKQKMTWNEALALREIQAIQNLQNHPNIVKIKEMSLKDQ